MKIIMTLLLLLLFLSASGQETELIQHTISWTHPTMRTDSTPLPIEQIQETRIWCLNTGWPPDKIVPAPATTVQINLPLGEQTCYAKTVDTSSPRMISESSTPVTFVVEKPKPPTPSAPDTPSELKVTQIIREGD